MIDNIVALTPLIKSIAWIALLAWLFWKYGSLIGELVAVARSRVHSGSAIKMGPIEIGEHLETQSIATQKSEAVSDARALQVSRDLDESILTDEGSETKDLSPSNIDIAEIFMAEDLTLRALQDEVQRPIIRKIKLTGGFLADGLYTCNGKKTVVDIVSAYAGTAVEVTNVAISRLEKELAGTAIEKYDVLICIIYFDSYPVEEIVEDINRAASGSMLSISTKSYDYYELLYRFGLPS